MRVRKCCAVVFIRLLVLLTYNQLMHVGLSQKCIWKILSLYSPYVTFTIYLFVEKTLKWSCILLLMNQHLEFPIHWFKNLNIQHSEHWNICEFWVCVDMECIMISWFFIGMKIFFTHLTLIRCLKFCIKTFRARVWWSFSKWKNTNF